MFKFAWLAAHSCEMSGTGPSTTRYWNPKAGSSVTMNEWMNESLWGIILTYLMVCYIYSNNWYFTLCQEADLIRQGADQTKNDAGKVRDEAEALEGRVAVTANKIKEFETLAAQDEELTTVVSACALAPCSLECRCWSDKMHTLLHPRR